MKKIKMDMKDVGKNVVAKMTVEIRGYRLFLFRIFLAKIFTKIFTALMRPMEVRPRIRRGYLYRIEGNKIVKTEKPVNE